MIIDTLGGALFMIVEDVSALCRQSFDDHPRGCGPGP
jgi:hypothetical protein